MTQKRILLLLLLLVFFLLFFFMLINMPYSSLSKWLTAQVVQMSLTIHSLPTLTINGNVLTPTQSGSHQFETATGSTFLFLNPDGSFVEITFFSGTTQATLDFFIDAYEKSAVIAGRPLPPGKEVIGSLIYDMRAFIGSVATSTFDNPFSMKVGYTDALVTNANEETMNIYFWDDTQNQWVPFSDPTRDLVNNTITVLSNHLTLFAALGDLLPTIVTEATTQKRGGGGPIGSISRVGTLVTPAIALPIELVSDYQPIDGEETRVSVPEDIDIFDTSSEASTEKQKVDTEVSGEDRIDTIDESINAEITPTLFDIGITPSTGEPLLRERGTFVTAIVGMLTFIATLGVGIFFISRRRTSEK